MAFYISYVYNAVGTKLKKTVSAGGSVTEYAGGFIYQDNALQFFGQPEGYVTPNGMGGYDYVYQYKDHLGNIRLSYVDNAGTLEIVEENNYYPFGLKHKGYNEVTSSYGNSAAQKWKFGGKEYEDGLNESIATYDFGARNYDPALGRWMNIDPLADKYFGISPYNYAVNNPLVLADPDGRDAIVTINGNTITVTTNIFIYGSGASEKRANRIQNAINELWNKNNNTYTDEEGNEYNVVFETNVDLYDPENPTDDPFIISESWDSSNTDNFIEVVKDHGRSYVRGGDEGKWFTQGQMEGFYSSEAEKLMYAHEFGHLLGLDDRYSDSWFGFGKSTVDQGYEGQIMADGSNVDQRAINGVVRESVEKYNKFTEKYGNKKAANKPYTTKIDIARPRN